MGCGSSSWTCRSSNAQVEGSTFSTKGALFEGAQVLTLALVLGDTLVFEFPFDDNILLDLAKSPLDPEDGTLPTIPPTDIDVF